MKKTKKYLLVGSAILFVGIVVFVSVFLSNTDIVMEVNGEKIGREEYEFYEKQYESEEGRLEDIIVRKKVEQQLAVEWGVAESFRFEDMKRQMEKENEENKRKKENGQPVYGMLEYRLEQFYQHKYSNAVLRLKETLIEDKFQITGAEEKAFYEENKEKLFRKVPEGIYFLFRGDDTEEIKNRMLQVQAFPINEINELDQRNIEGVEITRLELNEETMGRLENESSELAEQIAQLEKGEFSNLIEDGYLCRMVYCQTKEEEGVKSFEEVEDIIRGRIGDIEYEKYVTEKVKNAEVHIK